MNFHSDCPHCQHRISAYTAQLNRGLALAFLLLVDARVRLGRAVEKHELVLSHGQYGNFQKLRYWDLIFQHEDGSWDVTATGMAFFRGEVAVLSPAGHFNGEALPEDHLAWATHAARRRSVFLRDVLPEEWKQREEYRLEKKDAVA